MNRDLISRTQAMRMLHDKAQGYTVSMFSTSGECWVARTVVTECVAEIGNMVEAREDIPREVVHLGGDEWSCPVCGYVIHTEGSWERPSDKYCRECGQKLQEKEQVDDD